MLSSAPGPGKGKRSGKGVFGRMRLPVAGRYLMPPSRRALLLLGLVVGLLVILVGLWETFFGQAAFLSGGPLSSAHATLEQDCASCHGGFQAVVDTSCSACHEQVGQEVGNFSFDAHYVYRSGDFQRLGAADNEMTCATCHPEHQGRQGAVLDVPDSRCQTCHERSHFDKDHPQFAFAEDPTGDDDALSFAHGPHVREVMERGAWVDLERACLACHQPTADGRNFEPISFDLHCDSCHLNAGLGTPRLAVATSTDGGGGASDGGNSDGGTGDGELGVWTLDMIRASGLPATDWSFYMNPSELRGGAGRVVKTPLHHEDPWVLFNLRRLRRLRFPDAGLADYLTATPDLDAAAARDLYAEAVATLERQVVGLRGSADPEVQAQLVMIENRLDQVRQALADPSTPLDETELLLALSAPVELGSEELETWQGLVDGLTSPCVSCHRVENATIARVREDQRTMIRAEFDHGSHILQRRCLDCHGELPILEALSVADGSAGEAPTTGDDPIAGDDGTLGQATPSMAALGWDSELDRAEIHNLPPIESCRECHTSGVVASRCVDCHLFHPNAQRHGDLLLYQP